MDDLAVMMLSEFVQGGVRRGELLRGNRTLRWVEAGSGHPAVVFDAGVGEPGSLAWAGVLPAVAMRTRVIAYDRAGIGASDPVSQLTLEGEIADLAAVVTEAGDGPCVLVGHSWGGLLAQLVAFDQADLIAGLVLIDPAHEETLSDLSWPLRVAVSAQGNGALLLHSLGLLGRTVRRTLRPFARRLTGDPRVQGLILDAYASCFAKRTQVRMLRDENRLSMRAAPRIRQLRATSGLPEVPLVVLSASKGLPQGMRARWTALHADLAKSAARGEHIVLDDTGHVIHQERPEQVTTAVLDVVERLRLR
jgi:pimeloyl-ACP methyl ester carboxylesterase